MKILTANSAISIRRSTNYPRRWESPHTVRRPTAVRCLIEALKINVSQGKRKTIKTLCDRKLTNVLFCFAFTLFFFNETRQVPPPLHLKVKQIEYDILTFIFTRIFRTLCSLFLHFTSIVHGGFSGVMFTFLFQSQKIFFSHQFI